MVRDYTVFLSSLSVDTDISADTDLLGKVVGDLQANIDIGTDAISGTLKYVTGYTGFSGTTAEQSGNYIALHCEAFPTADSITVELIGGTVGHPITLDSDGLIVIRITDTDTQSIEVVATKGASKIVKRYTLNFLTLEEA